MKIHEEFAKEQMPHRDGLKPVWFGETLTQSKLPRGVKKFAFWQDDGAGWTVLDYKKGLVYPAGINETLYCYYIKQK